MFSHVCYSGIVYNSVKYTRTICYEKGDNTRMCKPAVAVTSISCARPGVWVEYNVLAWRTRQEFFRYPLEEFSNVFVIRDFRKYLKNTRDAKLIVKTQRDCEMSEHSDQINSPSPLLQ